jgi:hypothetical protein
MYSPRYKFPTEKDKVSESNRDLRTVIILRGPLLFSLYINDLPNCLEQTEASMFADDTNISSIGNSPADI